MRHCIVIERGMCGAVGIADTGIQGGELAVEIPASAHIAEQRIKIPFPGKTSPHIHCGFVQFLAQIEINLLTDLARCAGHGMNQIRIDSAYHCPIVIGEKRPVLAIQFQRAVEIRRSPGHSVGNGRQNLPCSLRIMYMHTRHGGTRHDMRRGDAIAARRQRCGCDGCCARPGILTEVKRPLQEVSQRKFHTTMNALRLYRVKLTFDPGQVSFSFLIKSILGTDSITFCRTSRMHHQPRQRHRRKHHFFQ